MCCELGGGSDLQLVIIMNLPICGGYISGQMRTAQLGERREGRRMGECGAWIQVIPDIFDGTELSRDEWHDNLTIRYGFKLKGLPQRCDRCSAGFTVL